MSLRLLGVRVQTVPGLISEKAGFGEWNPRVKYVVWTGWTRPELHCCCCVAAQAEGGGLGTLAHKLTAGFMKNYQHFSCFGSFRHPRLSSETGFGVKTGRNRVFEACLMTEPRRGMIYCQQVPFKPALFAWIPSKKTGLFQPSTPRFHTRARPGAPFGGCF